ncbi:MAG: winged helix-turn-helix domain-containing protein [Xanthomonadales bacterium]|nr:winged helix-turn-helix domain-containing protein [Xanthomonadales bacterium]MBL0222152.1 winged helix-turn-helix domain-containing protein [Xanthomonadales bacterium]HQV73177.1 winged helix-turn-helix domain-containing protein [Dokdonella sp.]HQY54891.1 winged helix-turn-helix domain-containing protein [Dokdonella sp.]HQZ62363.1 winged helix-turn-helix domain-containing protein [Dokdonella sp.]
MTSETGVYRFGDVEVEPAAHRITRDGADLAVEPKAFAVLASLLEQPGKVLERDELLDRVWGHRHVTPGVLNRVVAQLRKALGDDAENPRYIQTLHGLGYRFIAEVHSNRERRRATQPQPTTPLNDVTPIPGTPPARSARLSAGGVGLLLGAVVLAALAFAWMRAGRLPTQPAASIAILPFTSLSSNPDDGYFAEGLREEMHAALAGVNGLKVAALIASTARPGATEVKALGEKLGVASVLEASVRRQGQRVRINARLSDTSKGFTLWTRSYDRELADVFDTQSEIANEVVQSLIGVIPGEREALARRLAPTRDVLAFDDYLQGLHLLRDASAAASQDKAIERFAQALQKDSGFARAQAGICRAEIWKFEYLHSIKAFNNARIACQRALTMDSSLADVGLALGDLYRVQGEPENALEQYRRIESEPAVRTRAQIGMAKVYAAQGHPELAEEYFRKALQSSPDDAQVHAEIGYRQYLDGHVPEAIAAYRKAVELEPGNDNLWGTLGGLYMEAGNNAEAARALDRSVAIEPSYSALTNLGLLKYQDGDYAAAAALQQQATQLNPLDFMVWANLGMALKADPANAAQARGAYAQAATRAEDYIAAQPNDARAIAALGLYRAELGDPGKARALLDRAEALGTQSGEVALLNAETLALLGDLPASRARLATARKAGIAESLIASNTVFRRLGLLAQEQ